jgi:hypothetical protein
MAVVVFLAMTKPDSFGVQRTVRIKALPDRVFSFINDFHNWPEWSPYEKIDPAMKRALSGSPSGVGAVYEWDGAGKAGAGRMEIIESMPSTKVGIKLDFLKPFEGHNTAAFTLTPRGEETEVSWSIIGPAPFLSKVMQVIFNLDKLIGRDFEVGLQNLKTASEK